MLPSAQKIRKTIASLAIPPLDDPELEQKRNLFWKNLKFLMECCSKADRGSDMDIRLIRGYMLGAGILAKLSQISRDLDRIPEIFRPFIENDIFYVMSFASNEGRLRDH